MTRREKLLYCGISQNYFSMMKKRTLLIGLGGVGGQVLLAWRRAMSAGGMPPVGDEHACLYLDAADDVVSTPEWQELAADIPYLNIKTEARSLNEMEQNTALKDCVGGMRWQVADALKVPVYEVEKALHGLSGAGGWRRYGRALLLQSRPAVERRLSPLVEGVEQLTAQYHRLADRCRLAGDRPLAAGAADKGLAVAKGVDGQLTVVAAQAADFAAGLLPEGRQFFPAE